MVSKLIEEAMISLSADKDWPDNVILYKSLEDQELLPDIARCYCVEALFAAHELGDNFSVTRKHNAEHMAPKIGRLPFLRVEDEVIGKDDILDFMQKKEKQLFLERTVQEDLCIKGVLSLIENELTPIELYAVWVDDENLKQTIETYSYNQPYPLKKILSYQKQHDVHKYLNVTGWLTKSKAEIIHEARRIFEFFSKKLQHSKFIVGNQLSEADVFAYGHLQAILESKLKNNYLLETLQQYPRLADFCLHFSQVYLGKQAMIF